MGELEKLRAKKRAYGKLPHVQAKAKAYYARSDVKARRSLRQKELLKNPTFKRSLSYKRRLHKLKQLGLSAEQGKAELAKTTCDCCGRPFGEESPHIDHDHKTNTFRGMVHPQCNIAIGMMGDDVGGLILASRYVDTFRKSPLSVDSGESFLKVLSDIAEEDAAGLKKAFASYGPSWKQGGGTNAYAMLKRKWDRLVNRLAKPGIDGDIFKGIATDERGEGMIDDVRDLRRYLMLVEAEMRARGYQRGHRDNTKSG